MSAQLAMSMDDTFGSTYRSIIDHRSSGLLRQTRTPVVIQRQGGDANVLLHDEQVTVVIELDPARFGEVRSDQTCLEAGGDRRRWH